MLTPPLKVLLWLLLLLPVTAFTPARFKAWRRKCGAPTLTIRTKQSTVTAITRQTALHAITPTPTTHQHHHHRNIVVLSHNVSQDVADGFFDTNHLLHGRVDVLVRCANAALWISNNIRKDTSVFLMLFPHNMTIEIKGCAVANLNPDERTMALYIQRTLLASNLDSHGGDGDNGAKEREDESSSLTGQLSRREVELSRLKETKRQRPETINPFKPGALPKSERQRLSVARKQREAMVRRIKKAAAKSQDSDSSDAGADNNDNAPAGFLLHQNDSLAARLEQFSATGPVLMLNKLGEPLSNVLKSLEGVKQHADRTDATTISTTTLILGDQIGYAESDEKLMAESRSGSGSGVRQVSLGPLSLLTSQCITISHHYLDLLSQV
jgi:tRNA pseudouridine-54 N-methylase